MAEKAPLLVDEPMHEEDIERCKKKAVVMKGAGYRYIWVSQKTTLADALSQLGEL